MKNQSRTQMVEPASGVGASPRFLLAVAVGCVHVGPWLWRQAVPRGPVGPNGSAVVWVRACHLHSWASSIRLISHFVELWPVLVSS